MGFPNPIKTWGTERLRSADLNSQLRDAILYLKGRAGDVEIEDNLIVWNTGSATEPGIGFQAAVGIFRKSTTQLGFVTDAQEAGSISVDGLIVPGILETSAAGSAANPALLLSNGGDKHGLYHKSATELGFAIDGTERAVLAATGLLVPDGAAATPGLRTTTEAHGLYRSSATELGFSIAGAAAALLRANGLTVPDGAAANPGLRLTSEAHGLHRKSSSQLGFAVAGTEKAWFGANGLTVSASGTNADPAFRFASEASGMYLSAAGDIGWAVAGTNRMDLTATGLSVVGLIGGRSLGLIGGVITGDLDLTAQQNLDGSLAVLDGAIDTDASGTHPVLALFRLDSPTITNNGAAVTSAATFYISAQPSGGTNNYAIFVDAGLMRLDGDGTHILELPANATDPTGGGGAATGRIPVKIGGATRYLAYY